MAQFCYWQVFKDVDFFFLLVLGFAAALILLYVIKKCFSIVQLFSHIDKKFVLIYLFSLLWALLYVFKIAFLIIKYLTEVKDAPPGYSMFQLSQLFCVIDTLPTFFLMYLLILIPYFWLKNITIFLQRMRRGQRKDRCIIKFCTFYIYLRTVIFIALSIWQLSATDETLADTLCDSLIMIILGEVFLSLLLSCYGLTKMFRNFSSLNVHDKNDKRKFINEYLVMIVCSFMRFAMDFYFIIYDKMQSEENNCLDTRKNNYLYTTLYIFLGEILMHILPIATILSIYKADLKVVLEDSFIADGNPNFRKLSY